MHWSRVSGSQTHIAPPSIREKKSLRCTLSQESLALPVEVAPGVTSQKPVSSTHPMTILNKGLFVSYSYNVL